MYHAVDGNVADGIQRAHHADGEDDVSKVFCVAVPPSDANHRRHKEIDKEDTGPVSATQDEEPTYRQRPSCRVPSDRIHPGHSGRSI